MIRVLHCLGGLGTGGTEALIMSWYRQIDRENIQFDFLVRSNDDNYKNEILQMGGRIFYTPAFPQHAIANAVATSQIMSRNEWDVVHVHGNAALYLTVLVLAKKNHIRLKIMHSHNTNSQNALFNMIHYANRLVLPRVTDVNLACSNSAGKWMYGSKQFEVLKNAIDLKKYYFNEFDRKKTRDEFSIDKKFVIGHIGRFSKQKNHAFILDVFKNVLEMQPNAVLLLIGDGGLQPEVRAKAGNMGILDSIIFAGRRNDIPELLSSMDAFLFPSLWEGLGIVLIEAQTNGLHCFSSEEIIQKEVLITNLVHSISLKEDASKWARAIVNQTYDIRNRHIYRNQINTSGYDIASVVDRLERIYLDGCNR